MVRRESRSWSATLEECWWILSLPIHFDAHPNRIMRDFAAAEGSIPLSLSQLTPLVSQVRSGSAPIPWIAITLRVRLRRLAIILMWMNDSLHFGLTAFGLVQNS